MTTTLHTERITTRAGIQAMLHLAIAFHRDHPIPRPLDPDHWVDVWTGLVENGHAHVCVLVGPDGSYVGCIGILMHTDLSSGELGAQEAFWFVLPFAVGAMDLLHWAEDKARSEGATTLTVSALYNESGERLARVYRRLGYEAAEVSYQKEL